MTGTHLSPAVTAFAVFAVLALDASGAGAAGAPRRFAGGLRVDGDLLAGRSRSLRCE